MKKRIFRSLAGLLILAAVILPSCEFLEDCGYCELVTDDGTDITYGTPMLFCGDTYHDKDSMSPTVIGSATTYWSCN